MILQLRYGCACCDSCGEEFWQKHKTIKDIIYHSTITLHSIYPLEYSVADIQQPKI